MATASAKQIVSPTERARRAADCRTIVLATVLPSLQRGGTEGAASQLSVRLRERGYEAVIIALSGGGWEGYLTQNSVPTLILGHDSRSNVSIVHAARIIWSLRRIFRQLKPDIVSGFLYPMSIWSSLAAWLAGVPVVIANRRDCGFQRTEAPLPRWLEVLSYRATTRFVVNSRAVAKSLREQERIASTQIEVIHNGIDVSESDTVQSQSYRRTLGIDATSPVVGMMANFWRHKNHLMLVAAARRVVTEEPGVVFVLAGADSDYCHAVRVAIARFCLQRTFRVLGGLDNTEELLGILDIGVLCSESEGFSNTILEYMAYGLPVIATRVGGNPEAVVDKETGYLVDSHDSAGLARAILALVRNPAKRKEMGWRGRERIKAKFRWHRAVGECDALFQSLIANHLAATTKDR